MIKKCLFPAAGYGTRFLPATKATPKEMLPILTKPLIQYGVEEAIEAGIKTMAIVTGRGKRAIEDHFDISYELEHQLQSASKEELLKDIREIVENCTFTYTRQKQMLGLGHAILTGKPLIGEEAFAVILADDLCSGDKNGVLSQMIEVYKKYRCCIVAIEEIDRSETYKYGIVDGKLVDERDDIYRVSYMVEKPLPKEAPTNLAIIGRYILTPEIFEKLKFTKADAKGEIQITDALNQMAKEGKVIAYKFKGKRFDCGSLKGFVEATNWFYKNL